MGISTDEIFEASVVLDSFDDTYVLLNALHNFRNRAEHPDGQSIHLGVAVAALMACVELLGCLERELGAY